MSDSVSIEPAVSSAKRIRRTHEEKRRIVEASMVPGVSIARVAREHGVNANQLFQWRYEYRKGTLGSARPAHPSLMAVSLAPELPVALRTQPPVMQIEVPGRASVRVEAGMDAELVRIALRTLLR